MNDPLDRNLIAELQDLMESEFPSLLESYITDSLSRLDQIKASIDAGSAQDLRLTAHSLKGSSSNIGAVGVARLCQELEQKGRDNELAGSAPLFSQVCAELMLVHAALRALAH